MSLSTYLTFDGDCREAFEFYRSVFGGRFTTLQTFADGPPDMQVPEASRDRIMHASLPVGSSVLMGSDRVEAFGPPFVAGNNFSIALVPQSRDECDEQFGKLSDGGSVAMPLAETFWGAYYGLLTDRFGVNWMVNYPLSQG